MIISAQLNVSSSLEADIRNVNLHRNFGDSNKALKSNKMSNNLIALLTLPSITEITMQRQEYARQDKTISRAYSRLLDIVNAA